MKNQNKNQNTVADDFFDEDFLEDLFCETYDTDDFETAVEDCKTDLDNSEFESEDELEVWLEDHQNDNALLKEAWDLDLWNNSVSELANQCYLQFGALNLDSVTRVLSQWQHDWEELCED